ncbi:o-succinylbenzoate synthase [Actinomycetaceae bacterium MB13-C1-2]|nr:o-succinylbenzoate synthase [Actinomycetaceae bacterium MB13-C1-2]
MSAVPLGSEPAHVRQLLGDVDEVVVYQVPLTTRFRGVTQRQGLLLRGKNGWGECAPFWDYGPSESSRWLESAIECATAEGPAPRRGEVPVNVTIPVVPLPQVKARIERQPGCTTAKVKVADRGVLDEHDLARVTFTAELLAELYGERARVRVDANAAWGVDEAAAALGALDEAARSVGGLEYAEQPCAGVEELKRVRAKTGVPIAADESIRRAEDPLLARDAADVAVLKVAPLGGIKRCLWVERELKLPTVVSSALDTSIGLAAGVELAAALGRLDYACGLNTGSLLAADVVDDPLLSSAEQTPGYLSVDSARAVRLGELAVHADRVPSSIVEDWTKRLDAMALHLVAPLG